MTRVRFLSPAGALAAEIDVAPGERLLDVAQAQGQPLEGVCEGAMACSTCHVIISERDAGRLPSPSEEEEDMLDFAYGVSRNSRLACQIYTRDDLDTLEVRMPGGAVDMSR